LLCSWVVKAVSRTVQAALTVAAQEIVNPRPRIASLVVAAELLTFVRVEMSFLTVWSLPAAAADGVAAVHAQALVAASAESAVEGSEARAEMELLSLTVKAVAAEHKTLGVTED
jgi:hypothetical protein